MELQGRSVLITGGSEGIGAACAAEFRARGARLTLVARNRENLEQAAGREDAVVCGDVTRRETRDAAVEAALSRHGQIDVLVNNAGVGLYSPSWCAPMDEVRSLFEVNYFAALAMIQAVAPVMRGRGSGMIVNVSSIAGRVPLPWFTAYSSTKFALSALCAGLRVELKDSGIHVMEVCPGYVKTGFQDHALVGRPPDSLWKLRRFGITAGECAKAIVRGVERDARTVMAPRTGWLAAAGVLFLPGLVEMVMQRIYRGLDGKEWQKK